MDMPSQLKSGIDQSQAAVVRVGRQGVDRTYYSSLRKEMLPFLPTTYSRVLEIGCGEGAFAGSLPLPCESWGIEPNSASAVRAATRMTRVFAAPFEDVVEQMPTRYFDLVVCNDVIEHLRDPEVFLVTIQGLMTADGYLVASIPNVRHWEVLFELLGRKDWRYVESGILDRTHLRFFTQKSLRRLFQETGFYTEYVKGINGPTKLTRRLVWQSLTILTGGYLEDVQFRQFGVRARLKRLP